MSKKPSKVEKAETNSPAVATPNGGRGTGTDCRNGPAGAAHNRSQSPADGAALPANGPVEGGFSTKKPEILPEGLVENPGKTAHVEAQIDKGGRPTAMDETTRLLVCTLLAVGASRREAAAYFGVSHTTIGYAIAQDKAFADRVERAEQMATIKPLITIANVSNNNWKAAVWLLERNERRRKPTQEELREAQEERERNEKEAHERSLRQAREFKEWVEASRAPAEPESPPNFALAAGALDCDNPTPAGQATLDKVNAMMKKMAAELPEDDDWLDEDDDDLLDDDVEWE